MPLSPGSTILNNKYRIEAIIGEGAFGRVYKAWDTTLNRPVAIKELRADAAQFAEYAARFRREAQVQAQFSHPHLVHVYELIDQGDALYLVMEYVDGPNLRDYLAEHGPLPLAEAVRITLEVLDGLAVVHEHKLGIVHRDIKPSNILLTAQGQAKLTDFGLAQLEDESLRSRGLGGPHPGTPPYMSPEQANTRAYLKPASDLYSLGCVLFEMLTGQRYSRVRPGTKASVLRPGVPTGLDTVLVRSLAEDLRDRYQNAGEMIAALKKVKIESPRWPCMVGLGVAGLVILVVIVVLGMAAIGGQAQPTPTQVVLAPTNTPSATLLPTDMPSPPTQTPTLWPTNTPTLTSTPPPLTDTPKPMPTKTRVPSTTSLVPTAMSIQPSASATSARLQFRVQTIHCLYDRNNWGFYDTLLSVRVLVINRNGQGIAGIKVRIDGGNPASWKLEAITDGSGRCEFNALSRNLYDVTLVDYSITVTTRKETIWTGADSPEEWYCSQEVVFEAY